MTIYITDKVVNALCSALHLNKKIICWAKTLKNLKTKIIDTSRAKHISIHLKRRLTFKNMFE